MSEQTKPYDVPTPIEDKKADIAYYMRLRAILPREQVAVLVRMIEQVHALAVDRKCEQTVTLHFGEKGHLRGVVGSNGVRFSKYQPE